MQRTTLLAAGLVILGACKATPTFDGVPLTCSSDSTCPEGMRCFAGGCIDNSPPRIAPLGLRFIQPGTELTASAVVTDAEDDTLTITWTQLYDTSLLAEAHAGETLTVTTPADVLDTYVFEVIATDGYDATAAYLTVVAIDQTPPTNDLVYVSDIGTQSDDCGTIANPCATLDKGLARGNTIVLAATQNSTAYNACLILSGNQSIWGGFDANTWRFDPVLISRTEILCTTTQTSSDPDMAAVGHQMSGTTTVGHVTLRLVAELATWPAAYFAAVALSDAATLWGADVLNPAVPVPSSTMGVISDAAAGRLLGVNVRGDPGALDPPSYTLGIAAFGGGLEIAAIEGRGRVILNEPTLTAAVGVENIAAEVTVDGIEIRGGVAATLYGVISLGSDTTVHNSTIELRSFGTFFAMGISSGPCVNDCTSSTAAALTATDNILRLHGAVAGSIVATCVGVGIQHTSNGSEATTISGNTIELDGDIGLALGLQTSGGGTSITDNSVNISQSLSPQPGCTDFVAENYPNSPTDKGAIGAVLAGADGDTLSRNTITLEPRSGNVYGIYARDVDGVLISENTVAVAVGGSPDQQPLWWPAVAAVLFNDNDLPVPSTLEGNNLRVGDHAGQGTALRLRGVPSWYVVNNYLYGGDTNYNTGVFINPSATDPAWPKLAHNTIFGGTGLVSSAVRIVTNKKSADVGVGTATNGPVGMFLNNLLDAGDASGRRFVLDNGQGGAGDALGEATANLAQLNGAVRVAPRANATLLTAGLLGHSFDIGQLHLALPETGTFASFLVTSGTTGARLSLESWVPVGYAFDTAWLGNNYETTAGPLAIVAAPGRLSMSRLGGTTFDNFVTFLLGNDGSGDPLAPELLIVGEASGSPPLDVVFTTPTRMWVAVGEGIAGQSISFLGAVSEDDVALTNPGFIGISYADPVLPGIHRFYIVDQADTAPRLVVWPEFTGSNTVTLPAVVTAFATGHVDAIALDGTGEPQPMVAAAGFAPDQVPAVRESVVNLTAPSGSMAPEPVDLPDSVCDHGYVTAVAILRTIDTNWWRNDLWVGCDNGRVEGYALTNDGNWRLDSFFLFPAAPIAIPVELPVATLSSFNSYIIVTYQDSPEVTVIPPLKKVAPYDQRQPVSLSLMGDVGMRRAPSHLYEATGVIDPGSCNLALRAEPAIAHDLSLSAGPDDCDDTGTPLDPYPDISVTHDIDGDPRATATPEVGADERQ